MISQTQLARLRNQASKLIEQTFPTSLVIGAHTIPAARWSATGSASPELAGLFTGCDIVIRIQRANIPVGVEIKAERTTLSELGKNYRVEQVRDAIGDPGIVIGCKAA